MAAGELAAQDQSLDVAGAEIDRLVGRGDRSAHLADIAAEAGDLGPGLAVLGRKGQRLVEGGRGAFIVALRAPRRGRASARRKRRVRAARDRPPRSPARDRPGEASMGHQMAQILLGKAELAGPLQLGLGGDPVAEQQIGPRLGDPEARVVRIGLDRVDRQPGRRAACPPPAPRGRARRAVPLGVGAFEQAAAASNKSPARRRTPAFTAEARIASSGRRASAG